MKPFRAIILLLLTGIPCAFGAPPKDKDARLIAPAEGTQTEAVHAAKSAAAAHSETRSRAPATVTARPKRPEPVPGKTMQANPMVASGTKGAQSASTKGVQASSVSAPNQKNVPSAKAAADRIHSTATSGTKGTQPAPSEGLQKPSTPIAESTSGPSTPVATDVAGPKASEGEKSADSATDGADASQKTEGQTSALARKLPKPRKITDNAKAVQEMEGYCKAHPNSWKGFYQLGCEYYKQGRDAQAVEVYEKAVKLCPMPEEQEPIFYNLGNALFYQAKALKNQRDKKIELLKKSLEHYNNALALNKEAKDTIHNIEIVKQVLERLQQNNGGSDGDSSNNPDTPPPDGSNNSGNDDDEPPPETDPEQQDAESILNSERQHEQALPTDFNQQSGGDDEVEQDW